MLGHTNHKFTLALNKKVDEETLMKVAVRAALALPSIASEEDRKYMNFLEFIDADGGAHPHISALSLIVMRGTSGELRKLREEAAREGIPFVDVTRSMCVEGARLQDERDPEYLGVMLFGKKSIVEPMTKKLSLWK